MPIHIKFKKLQIYTQEIEKHVIVSDNCDIILI
jgi:hypothetical protein